MEKQGTARIMEEIAILLELKGENPYKSRAYYSAARTVEMIGEEELRRLVQDDELKAVKGIGAALNEKIRELALTGSLVYYEELKASVPPGLLDMLKVPGLGPRKVRALYDMLEITTLAELEYACRENRLVNFKGFGAKTQANILDGIEFLRRYQGRIYLAEARRIAEVLIEGLKANCDLQRVSTAGSIRRCLEVVKDVDLVASSTDPGSLTRCFAALPEVDETVSLGETKATVRLVEGITVDLRAVRDGEFPYALHHFTGSKEHNTALRHLAGTMGMKINEYGLFRADKLVVCRDEEAFFAALGLGYIPPELRENNGELEAAAAGALPKLLKGGDISGIFHVHSTYSDGVNTLEELVRACREKGYSYIGITDHSQSAFYAGGLKEEDLARQGEEIAALREIYPDVGIFHGVEADIRADGTLDYTDEVLERLDFVIASVHSGLRMEREKMTARVKRALTHPLVTMLGHPTNRLLLGRDSSSLDLMEIFEAALEHGVILELNASPARLDLDWRHLKNARDMGLTVSINPDAHHLDSFDDVDLGIAMARKGWLEKKDVFNTRSREEVEAYLSGRKRRRL